MINRVWPNKQPKKVAIVGGSFDRNNPELLKAIEEMAIKSVDNSLVVKEDESLSD